MEKGVQVEGEDEDTHEGPMGLLRAADGNWKEETQDDTR